MEATKAAEHSQDSGRHDSSLNDRYGEIGISAVAGALHHRDKRRKTSQPRLTAYDSD